MFTQREFVKNVSYLKFLPRFTCADSYALGPKINYSTTLCLEFILEICAEGILRRNHLVSVFSSPLPPVLGSTIRSSPSFLCLFVSLSLSLSLLLSFCASFFLFLRLLHCLARAMLNSNHYTVYLDILTGKFSAAHNTANDPPRIFRESSDI